MKLIKITNNIFDWNILIDDVLIFIKASSFEKDFVFQLCKQAENLLYQYSNCVIIQNTYKMENNCNEDITKKYKSLVLKTEFCNDLVELNIEYEAGYDILTDDIIKYDMLNIIKALYNDCECEAMQYIVKYKDIIGYIENDTTQQCC